MTVLELINALETFEDTLEVFIPDAELPRIGVTTVQKVTPSRREDKEYVELV